jgi:hypothetical protein
LSSAVFVGASQAIQIIGNVIDGQERWVEWLFVAHGSGPARRARHLARCRVRSAVLCWIQGGGAKLPKVKPCLATTAEEDRIGMGCAGVFAIVTEIGGKDGEGRIIALLMMTLLRLISILIQQA